VDWDESLKPPKRRLAHVPRRVVRIGLHDEISFSAFPTGPLALICLRELVEGDGNTLMNVACRNASSPLLQERLEVIMQFFCEVCEVAREDRCMHLIEFGTLGYRKTQLFQALLQPFGVQACRNDDTERPAVWAKFNLNTHMPSLGSLNTALELTLFFIRLGFP